MFVVSMKANRGLLVAVAALGVALAMLLTQCGDAASASGRPTDTHQGAAADSAPETQGETDGTTG